MATGFEKFSRSVLSETPIKINSPADGAGYAAQDDEEGKDRAEVREPAAAYSRTSTAVAPRRAPEKEPEARKASGKRTKDRSFENLMVQISPDSKMKLDEMRFRLKKKYWEIVDEAIADLYDKYYRK